MAKGVLGNDPFKRGAAVRPAEKPAPVVDPAPVAPPPAPSPQRKSARRVEAAPAVSAKKPAAKKAAAPAPVSAKAKTATKKPEAARKPASSTKKGETTGRGRKVPDAESLQALPPPIDAAKEPEASTLMAAERTATLEPRQQKAVRVGRASPDRAEIQDAAATRAADAARVEKARVETARVEAARVEAARSEAAQVEAAQAEAARSETARAEASRAEAARTEATRVETARVETARVETARSEAARVEAARSETAPTDLAETAAVHRDHDEPAAVPTERAEVDARAVQAEPTPSTASQLRDRAAFALTVGRSLVTQAAQAPALSRVLETANGVFRALQTALGTAGASSLDNYGKDESLSAQLRPVSDFVYQRYWRVTVEGADKIPAGPAILVANHSGAVPFDGPVLQSALKRERPDLNEPRWLVEDQVFHAPFLGTLLNRLGAVRACPENALRLLAEGRPVIVFPEGIQGISKPFRERYKLMRFGRGGFVKLAIRTRTPIVPVAIVGAEEAMPLLGRLPGKMFGMPYVPITSPVPLPAKWTVRFGEPIQVDDFPPTAQEDLILVHKLNERTRESIQGMLDAVLKTRESVFA